MLYSCRQDMVVLHGAGSLALYSQVTEAHIDFRTTFFLAPCLLTITQTERTPIERATVEKLNSSGNLSNTPAPITTVYRISVPIHANWLELSRLQKGAVTTPPSDNNSGTALPPDTKSASVSEGQNDSVPRSIGGIPEVSFTDTAGCNRFVNPARDR
jgi:hypothetical protein